MPVREMKLDLNPQGNRGLSLILAECSCHARTMTAAILRP